MPGGKDIGRDRETSRGSNSRSGGTSETGPRLFKVGSGRKINVTKGIRLFSYSFFDSRRRKVCQKKAIREKRIYANKWEQALRLKRRSSPRERGNQRRQLITGISEWGKASAEGRSLLKSKPKRRQLLHVKIGTFTTGARFRKYFSST